MSQRGRPKRDDLDFLAATVEASSSDDRDTAYLARVFAQIALPYKDPGDVPEWVRRNGDLMLSVQQGPAEYDDTGRRLAIGYPYGSIPRLLLTWLSTEAVRTTSRELLLGESLRDFMDQLGLSAHGGLHGPITRLRDQMRRLFNARISVRYRESIETHEREAAKHLSIAAEYDLWWDRKQSHQPALWPSSVKLSQEFYDEVTTRPVPVNLTALRLLSGSPMRLDLYTWLTYRMSYLTKRTTVPWESLLFQFGSMAQTKQARRKFRLDFSEHLSRVLVVYPEARVEVDEQGVTLHPSPPHVSRGLRPALSKA